MQILLLYFFLFLMGSMLGWVIEVLFRRFFSAKKWVNPGFMKGPWLPLYGFGVVVMFTMCYLCIAFLPDSMKLYNPLGGLFGKDYVSGPTVADLLPISLMWIGMVLLEFLAGLIFIKGFHVRLWDYTNMKGNILGIICPVFTVIWLAVAVLFYYGVDPFLYVLSTKVHNYMFGGDGELAHFGFLFAMGIVYGLMIYDLVVSLNLFATIRKGVESSGVLERYESLKNKWKEGVQSAKKALKLDEIKAPSVSIPEPIKEKIAETIYIDPKKQKKSTNNYDENGRPIKIDEE
jgi:uncharacterized membrane protein